MDSQVCYMCYDCESATNPYASNPLPCDCKGSLLIHESCLKDIISKNIHDCTICKAKYNKKYLPKRNGLDVIIQKLKSGGTIEYTVNSSGKRHGLYIMRDEDNKTLVKYYYKDGAMDGVYIDYYKENGQIRSIGYFVNNTLQGSCTEWNMDGSLKEESIYIGGVKHGLCTRWENEGFMRTKIEENYVNGELTDWEQVE